MHVCRSRCPGVGKLLEANSAETIFRCVLARKGCRHVDAGNGSTCAYESTSAASQHAKQGMKKKSNSIAMCEHGMHARVSESSLLLQDTNCMPQMLQQDTTVQKL